MLPAQVCLSSKKIAFLLARYCSNIRSYKDFLFDLLNIVDLAKDASALDFVDFAEIVAVAPSVARRNSAEFDSKIAADCSKNLAFDFRNSVQVGSKTALDHSQAEFAHSKTAQQIADFVEFANFAELADSRRSNSADFAHPPHKDFDYNLVDSYYL